MSDFNPSDSIYDIVGFAIEIDKKAGGQTFNFAYPDPSSLPMDGGVVVGLYTFYLERLLSRCEDIKRWHQNRGRVFKANEQAEMLANRDYIVDAMAILNHRYTGDEMDAWRQQAADLIESGPRRVVIESDDEAAPLSEEDLKRLHGCP